MPIKPVSGKIKSQDINDNLSYLDSRVDKIITTPADGVSNQEIIDAREFKDSLGANVRDIRRRTNTSLVNIVKNSDFTNTNLSDYGGLFGTRVHANYVEGVPNNNSVVLTSDGSQDYFGAVIYQKLSENIPALDKWYVKARIRALDSAYGLVVGVRGTSGNVRNAILNVNVNQWYDISYYYDPSKVSDLSGEFRVWAGGVYESGSNNTGKRTEVENMLAINLTNFFGYGNEPTKKEMDDLLNEFPSMFFAKEADAGIISSFILKKSNRIEKNLDSKFQSDILNSAKNGEFNAVGGIVNDWRTEGASYRTLDKALELTGTGSNAVPQLIQKTEIPFTAGKKIYVRANIKINDNTFERARILLNGYGEFGDTQMVANFDVEPNTETVISNVFILEKNSTNVEYRIRTQYPSAMLAKDKTFVVSKPVVIDLTSVFGAGLEPSREKMDFIIDNLPNKWFKEYANLVDLQNVLMKYVFNQRVKGGDTTRPLIAFTFDDGFRGDVDLVYPAFKERGVTGTSYIWTHRIDNYSPAMNPDDLIELKLNGWGVECHTRDHIRLSQQTDEEIHRQMQAVNSDFERYGLPKPKHHALPFGDGAGDKRVTDIIMQYRKTVRNITFGSGHTVSWDELDFSGLPATSLNRPEHSERAKRLIDEAVASNNILIFVTHDVVVENPTGDYQNSIGSLMEVVDYAIEKGMTFVTIDELYKRVLEYKELISK